MIVRLICAVVAVVLLTVACGYSVDGEEQSQGSGIIYLAGYPEHFYSIGTDGSHKQLFKSASFGKMPQLKWSPDGTRVMATTFHATYTSSLRMQQADGTSFLLLPQAYLAAHYPSWSPDSERVVVTATFWYDMAVDRPRNGTSNSRDWRTALLIVNADGSNLRQIAGPYGKQDNIGSFGYGVESGGWSPDGSQLVYWTTTYRRWLYGCNAHEPDVVPEVEYCPDYFVHSRVYLTDGEGVSRQLILNVDGSIETLSWSPDGEWFLLSMWRDDDEVIGAYSALYRVRSDGTDLQQLTYPPGPHMHFDEGPVLSPDGSRLWFYNNRRVYVMKADGSELAAVTEEQVSTIPRVYWSPDSHYLAIYAYESCRKVFLHHIESSTKDDLGCLGTPVAWSEPQTLNRVHDLFHDPS